MPVGSSGMLRVSKVPLIESSCKREGPSAIGEHE